jgi:hypothetical protein
VSIGTFQMACFAVGANHCRPIQLAIQVPPLTEAGPSAASTGRPQGHRLHLLINGLWTGDPIGCKFLMCSIRCEDDPWRNVLIAGTGTHRLTAIAVSAAMACEPPPQKAPAARHVQFIHL